MIHTLTTTAAQNGGGAASSSLTVVIWAAVLLCIVIAGGLGVLWMRRRLFQRPPGSPDEVLEEMRGMRDRGLLTPEEFAAVRRAGIERLKSAQSAPPDPSSGASSPRGSGSRPRP